MRIFVTGASGFIGTALVKELFAHGHQVLGLARSDAAAATVAAMGAAVLRGSLEDLDSLRRGAADSDGVVHTAFIHNFADLAASGAADRHAITAIGDVLAGSGRPLVITSGTALLSPGRVSTEADMATPTGVAAFRAPSETLALGLAERGVRASVVRLPPSVHGDGDVHGFVPRLIALARDKGAAAYVGDGQNRWAAVHRLDAARLFRLAVEKGVGGHCYHGVGDAGVPARAIATVIAQKLGLPLESKTGEQIDDHFGWIGHFFALDCPSSSARTQAELGWRPEEAGLLDDMAQGHYFIA
ncbi:MAG: SDR family oxidoreductase [Paludibacterium sp.]|uniref:SDR family oxidoreductase n=1 Tax=Paludibacterium sp. TaxID=1917523 RepID=UPI0025E48A73|nr:SDR family oxidoreductase [Paludibacterium sp.]MBV8046972.1 SDR family oxidoreductase [Paludibacterium sp.]